MMEKRKFTKEEKLAIIKEVSEHGLKSTLEKHSLYAASYYSWKKKLDDMGEEGFTHGITPAQIKSPINRGIDHSLVINYLGFFYNQIGVGYYSGVVAAFSFSSFINFIFRPI
ncbi:MAG: transposase [Flavobacteriales bacterium]|nr:transposase [Flavobacteriales bacterium]